MTPALISDRSSLKALNINSPGQRPVCNVEDENYPEALYLIF
jgi:hypothetical protein